MSLPSRGGMEAGPLSGVCGRKKLEPRGAGRHRWACQTEPCRLTRGPFPEGFPTPFHHPFHWLDGPQARGLWLRNPTENPADCWAHPPPLPQPRGCSVLPEALGMKRWRKGKSLRECLFPAEMATATGRGPGGHYPHTPVAPKTRVRPCGSPPQAPGKLLLIQQSPTQRSPPRWGVSWAPTSALHSAFRRHRCGRSPRTPAFITPFTCVSLLSLRP